jgi:WD40 repeat protein
LNGSVYEYSIIKEGQRLQDWVHKGTTFTSVCIFQRDFPLIGSSKDKKKEEDKTSSLTSQSTLGSKNALYLVGSDKMIKEINNRQLVNYIDGDITLGQICLTNCYPRSMFCGIAENEVPGSIRCYSFPLDGEYMEYQTHSLGVMRISVTFDDNCLVSAGDDGSLYIWDIHKKMENKKKDIKDSLPFADEILVTRTFLDDKQAALLDLERQVEELSNQIDFQLRHRDAYHKEKMAELEDKYGQEIEQERTNNDMEN